jgi:hypothetical protein
MTHVRAHPKKAQVSPNEYKTQVGWSVDLKFMHVDRRLN